MPSDFGKLFLFSVGDAVEAESLVQHNHPILKQ